MKIVIFSDTHLGNIFDQKKSNALQKIVESADQVIINGDFWDYHLCSLDEFLNSSWNTLFPLLKARNTQYTFGNHDPERLVDDRVLAFCDHYNSEIKIPLGDKILRIQHGNKITPSIDETLPIVLSSKKLVRLSYKVFESSVQLMGKSFLKIGILKNKKMKRWARRNLKDNEILICGDSHWAEIDLNNMFVNSGLIRFGYLEYIQIKDGQISLERGKY